MPKTNQTEFIWTIGMRISRTHTRMWGNAFDAEIEIVSTLLPFILFFCYGNYW